MQDALAVKGSLCLNCKKKKKSWGTWGWGWRDSPAHRVLASCMRCQPHPQNRYFKKLDLVTRALTPGLGSQIPVICCIVSLVCVASPRPVRDPSSKGEKPSKPEAWHPRWTSGLHVHTHMCGCIHKHTWMSTYVHTGTHAYTLKMTFPTGLESWCCWPQWAVCKHVVCFAYVVSCRYNKGLNFPKTIYCMCFALERKKT